MSIKLFSRCVFCIVFIGLIIKIKTYAYGDSKKIIDFNQYFSKEQIIEDIDFVLNTIRSNHVAAIEKIPDEILSQKDTEISRLPNNINILQEWQIICQIVAKLHDAHTSILGPAFLKYKLPFDVESVDQKFFCKNGNFEGFEITLINGISIKDLYENFKLHFSYEIEELPYYNFFESPSDFIPDWKLCLAGIDIFRPIEITFQKGTIVRKFEFDMIEHNYFNDKDDSYSSYKFDEEKNLGIFKLDYCIFNKEYTQNVNEFFMKIKAYNIKNIVIDLRSNLGGDCLSWQYFCAYLKNISQVKFIGWDERKGNNLIHHEPQVLSLKDFSTEFFSVEHFRKTLDLYDGNIFVLTSHATFSAGKDFAIFFSDNNLATIIGEIPGNSPNQYGDSTEIYHLPNSKLKFRTSSKKIYRPDTAKDPNKFIPDIQVPAKDAIKKVYEIITTVNNQK